MPMSFFLQEFVPLICIFPTFLHSFLSNGGDRGLRIITAAAVQLWCLLAFACDELTTCLLRVDRVTSQPDDEFTGDKLTVWWVDHVMSWLAAQLSSSSVPNLTIRHGLIIMISWIYRWTTQDANTPNTTLWSCKNIIMKITVTGCGSTIWNNR